MAPLLSRLAEREREREGGGDAAAAPATSILILCPNAALCDQVAATAGTLLGDPAAAARISSTPPLGPPPRIAVATPASLLATTGPGAGRDWTPDAVIGRTGAVVVDEADALLGGGFRDASRELLDGLRAADAATNASQAEEWAGLGPGGLAELPLAARRAARAGGARALARAWPSAPASLPPPPPPPPRRQYIFCGATLPEDARMLTPDGAPPPPPRSRRARRDAPAGALLRMEWPTATWITAPDMHAPPNGVEVAWVALERDGHGAEWAAALVTAARAGAPPNASPPRTLVFAATSAAVDDAVAALHAAGLPAAPYSAAARAETRAEALAAFRAGAAPILVATDAAARGLDVAAVAHVIQADFAANAVEWLHRVGRTARAGTAGRATCVVAPASAALAAAVRASVEKEGEGGAAGRVDGAFSRKRSFRHKMKRYGVFVPRGESRGAGEG